MPSKKKKGRRGGRNKNADNGKNKDNPQSSTEIEEKVPVTEESTPDLPTVVENAPLQNDQTNPVGITVTVDEPKDVQNVTSETPASDNVPIQEEIQQNVEEEDQKKIEEESSESVKPKKKKKFSFMKKKRSESQLQDEPEGGKSVTVKRAHSISVIGREEGKTKIPRFRFGGKKKSVNSTSNIETTSLVINPGMDSWRMEGLLGSAEKANSVHSLNTSGLSKTVKSQPTVIPKEKEASDAKTETVSPPQVTVNGVDANNIEKDYVNTNTDFEYSAEIHNGKPKKEKPNVTITVTPTRTPEKADPTSGEDAVDGELYTLEDDSVVSVQTLDKVAREQKMELSQDVAINDWLVLNLSPRAPVIESF